MRQDSKLPLYALPRGFSSIPGEKEHNEGEASKPEEELEADDKEKTIKSQKNSKNKNTNKKKHSKRIRRGQFAIKQNHMTNKFCSNLKMFSTNGAGIKNGKVDSLTAEVRNTGANIVTIQETHCTQKGKIKMDQEFVVFEAIRAKKGGGTLIAIHEDLNPKLVEEYNDEFELLVVEINTEDLEIRVISGYGPQENLAKEKRLPFFIALETEIEKAELAGKAIIIEMDANAKLGSKYIPGDPHGMTPNGALLSDIIERHALCVGNGSEICKGTITRIRNTRDRNEKSVIDIVMFSADMKKHIKSMLVDEERLHVLTKVRKTKNGVKVKESDHNVIVTEFTCRVSKSESKADECVYNLKNKECQLKFKKYTSDTKMLSSTVDKEDDIDRVIERFMKKVDGCIALNFEKKRINKKKTQVNHNLHDKRRLLKTKTDAASQLELAKVTQEIADKAESNFMKLKEELQKLDPNNKGIDSKQLWKLKKKLCPKVRDPPSAMMDKSGNLLTSDKALQKRAIEVYAERLEGNVIMSPLKNLEDDVNTLCEIRVKISKSKTTDPWSLEDLKEVLKQLKPDKSRDPDGYINEIFKESTAGSDLILGILKIMNMIKKQQKYPKILEKCNISSIHKKKSRKDFENYRGIFRVPILRSILDRLTYNDSYYTIDSHLTDGNVGARKDRSVRDNIFVLSAIINSVSTSTCEAIQVQVLDATKCFDKLWLQACINSLYEAGIDNDTLNLLYMENRNAQVAVKINNKLSARISVRDVVMQGSVWGSIKCTTTMDTMNQTAMADKTLQYYYKGDPQIPIGVLGMVGDTLGVTKCGKDAIRKNAFINSFMETQRLVLSKEKSSVLHFGSKTKCPLPCPALKVHNDAMEKKVSTKYLGNILSTNGGQDENIEDRRCKGWGKIATIMGILSEVDMGVHKLEAGLMLRQAI